MRVPLPWLREYCDPELDVHGIEERLTMTGTKVEAIHRHGVPSAENFVVGRVLSAERHPDADRLKVCSVELGLAEGPASIVCGAPNVAAGQTVAVARPGALMPDGSRLRAAKLRGVLSEGMILSEQELQIDAGASAGIMVLADADAEAEADAAAAAAAGASSPREGLAPGTPLAQVLPIAVDVLELEITPNRPDCLGVYGIARELHAASGAALAPAPWSEDPGSPGELAGVHVDVRCPELCPRFTARAFEDVVLAPSPPWLKARLMAAGMRPISNIVDITNYVMLLTGQPLHAFDLDLLAGARLTVRTAHDGEQVQTLDGQTRTLDSQMVLIEDADGPTSIAGLMGGARSEVQSATRRVLLEVASWSGPNIHRSSWKLGLRSEASGRFEKGLQPEQCMHAQALATRLMQELCGARALPGTIDVGGPQWETSHPPLSIRLRESRVHAILGVPVERSRQAEILGALDFASARREDGLEVLVPALRREDVTREIDLIEEVARIDGLERLPVTLPARRGAAGRLTHRQRVRRAAEDAIAGRGLHEIVGWSFAEPALLDRLLIPPQHPLRRVIEVENPLSADQSIMRPTLLGSLLDAARHNVSRNRPDVAIFESGTVYRAHAGGGEAGGGETGGETAGGEAAASGPGAGEPAGEHATPADEHHALGVLLSGHIGERSWRGERMPADFFAAKALLAELLDRFHVSWSVAPAEWPFLHPGRSAAVLARADRRHASESDGAARADEPLLLGFLGELHPLVAQAWDLPHSGSRGADAAGARTAAFAVDLGGLAAAAPEVLAFRAFGAFPVLRQDLAVTLPLEVSAEDLLARVRDAGGETLAEAHIFDVYSGEQVGEGRRSLALALAFRALDRTLTDEDVAPARERVLHAMRELGGELRG
ncbi:MAG TPA: phenylalanine--tRNA ligase subunit beta [Solirubrobacteraceae bacterium]|nr:phenylalanine--tRNA ligase subunit beta [Solirubrobacteraceae bacterium]